MGNALQNTHNMACECWCFHAAGAYVAQSQLKTAGGNKFAVNITSQFVVPDGGDSGTLQIEVPALGIKQQQALVLGEQGLTEGVKLRRTSTAGLVMATFNTNFTIDAGTIELWWPAGYGKQPLYDIIVSFTPASMEKACAIPGDAADKGATRKLLDTFIAAAAEEADYKSDNPLPMGGTIVAASGNLPPACTAAAADFSTFRRRIGFRTVELVRLPIAEAVKDIFPKGESGWGGEAGFYQQKDNSDGHWAQTKDGIWKHFDRNANQTDVDGESFYFKVNGVPIYMKVRPDRQGPGCTHRVAMSAQRRCTGYRCAARTHYRALPTTPIHIQV